MTLGTLIYKMAIRFEPDIVTSRQKTRRIASHLGFDSQDQVRIATAVSELARNVFQYAGTGEIEFHCSTSNPQFFYVSVSDNGPGIADLPKILSGGYKSRSGMGIGLIGTKKLMDYFDIQTPPSGGTVAVVGKKVGKQVPHFSNTDLRLIADGFAATKPINAFEELQNQNRDLLDALEEVRKSRESLAALNNELAETTRGVVSLYAELDKRAASLEIANEALVIATSEAEYANEAKSRFLSNMSHEIRTPLGIIQGFSELAMEPELKPSERLEFLTTISRNAENLTKLIGQILDLAKIEAGKIEIENTNFSLPTLVNEVVSAFDLQAKDKGIGLRFEILGPFPELVTSDSTRLRQVLINMISNALKFTEKGGVVISAQVQTKTAGATENCIEFRVKDTGIGLTFEQQGKLFQVFTQADSSTTRKFGGSGLGLVLSKKLAQALGGDLTLLQSKIDQGSTFLFHFNPGEIIAADLSNHLRDSVSQVPIPFSNELKNMKVLLVEDSVDNQKLFTRYLKRAGALVDIANDGVEGVNFARSYEYDVVLMDMQMPNLDGYGATEILRAEGYQMPIVALTAHAMREDRENALKKGFTHYLTKPLHAAILINTLLTLRSPEVAKELMALEKF